MITDPHRVRVLCAGMYRELRKLGDTPDEARSALAPIYAQLDREAEFGDPQGVEPAPIVFNPALLDTQP